MAGLVAGLAAEGLEPAEWVQAAKLMDKMAANPPRVTGVSICGIFFIGLLRRLIGLLIGLLIVNDLSALSITSNCEFRVKPQPSQSKLK